MTTRSRTAPRTSATILGTLLMGLAHLVDSERALFFGRDGIVRVDLPFFDVMAFDLASAAGKTKAVFIASIVAVFAGGFIALAIRSGTGRQIARALRENASLARTTLISLAIFAIAFIPVGGARVLMWFFLGVPGVVLLLYGTWGVTSRMAEGIGARLSAWFFGMPAGRLLLGIFTITFVLTNLFSYFVFDHKAHVVTGVAHLFHAEIFSTGQFYVDSHPLREFFHVGDTVINNGRWYSHFPAGHTILILIGSWFGMPWIINPLTGSLAVVSFYFLGKEMFDEKVGRLGALLGMLSPFLLFMSSEYYNHTSSLLFCSLFMAFYARTVNTGKVTAGLMAGVLLGLAMHTRLVTAFAMCIPFALYAGWLLIRQTKRYLPALTAMLVAVLAFVALLLYFNNETNGEPLKFAYAYSQDQTAEFGDEGAANAGMHWGREDLGEKFTPAVGMRNTVDRFRSVNKALYEWPFPSLFFVLLLFMAGTRNRWDYLILASFGCGFAVYFFWYFPAFQFGPRYLFYAIGGLSLLTARGILKAPDIVRGSYGFSLPRESVQRCVMVLVALCVLTVPFNGYRLIQGFTSEEWDWQIDEKLLTAIDELELENSVVFVSSSFRTVFLRNELDVDSGSVIYANDLGDKQNVRLMRHYPDRRYYVERNHVIREITLPAAVSEPAPVAN